MEILDTGRFQPDIIMAGIRLGEPMIALTSIIVALVCFYGAWRIQPTNSSTRLGQIFLALTGVSTLIGGIVGHAFLHQFPFEYKLAGWLPGMLAVSAVEQASIVRLREIGGRFQAARWLSWVNMVELTLSLTIITTLVWFPLVEIHSAFGFLGIVLPIEWMLYREYKRQDSYYLLLCVGLLVAAVLAHILKFSFCRWFSFFDIAHVFMAVALWQASRAFRAADYVEKGDLQMQQP